MRPTRTRPWVSAHPLARRRPDARSLRWCVARANRDARKAAVAGRPFPDAEWRRRVTRRWTAAGFSLELLSQLIPPLPEEI